MKAVAKAARDLDPSMDVYVVGGAAEGRLTVLSDVDIIIPNKPLDALSLNELMKKVYARAVDLYNLPWDYPVEIHILTREEFEEAFTKRGKKTVKVEC